MNAKLKYQLIKGLGMILIGISSVIAFAVAKGFLQVFAGAILWWISFKIYNLGYRRMTILLVLTKYDLQEK